MKPPSETLNYVQGRHTLACIRRGRFWTFFCDFPEIAKRFDGSREVGPAVVAFQKAAPLGGIPRRAK